MEEIQQLSVNSDKEVEQASLDFDRTSTWRILIGGAKLSRGFTIEGLTVTYFRRATNMNSSLTQMGRWFGFRPNYRDLVRLYIARKARFGMKEIDLYEAFAGIAMDESAFREQLERYSEWDGDSPRVLPSQIPPLVTQHLSWLLPVAKNKMFNAVLVGTGRTGLPTSRVPRRCGTASGKPRDMATNSGTSTGATPGSASSRNLRGLRKRYHSSCASHRCYRYHQIPAVFLRPYRSAENDFLQASYSRWTARGLSGRRSAAG